jgi:hypothetical protein
MPDNPFRERGMITDLQRFFGRKRELREIFSCLHNGQNVSVVGDSKIGKSSLLCYIEAVGPTKLGRSRTICRLDLQRITSEEDLCREIVSWWGGSGYTVRELEQALSGRQVVLCLDEFEQIKGEGFTPTLPGVLRSLAQEPSLNLVVATRQPLETLFPDIRLTSPFYNIFTFISLGSLTEAEACEMLSQSLNETGVSFTEDEIAELLTLTGCHPYRLQLAAWALFEAKTGGEADWRTVYYAQSEEPIRTSQDLPQPGTGEEDTIRVFISSTMSDMQLERQAVIRVLNNLGLTPIFAEDWGSRHESPRDLCLEQVAASHIYVGIFWRRYGYVDSETNLSATEEEYRRARECGLPTLLYVKAEDDANRDSLLRRWLRELGDYGSGHVWSAFDTPQKLAHQVHTDVTRELRQMARRGMKGK